METKFSQFIRSGGTQSFLVPMSPCGPHQNKQDTPHTRTAQSLVGHVQADNLGFLTTHLGDDFQDELISVDISHETVEAIARLEARFAAIPEQSVADDNI